MLLEFSIAAKKDDKHTNNKNGKDILVRLIASSILAESFTNPGAIKATKNGIKISIIRTKKKRAKNNRLKISLAKLVALNLLFTSSEV